MITYYHMLSKDYHKIITYDHIISKYTTFLNIHNFLNKSPAWWHSASSQFAMINGYNWLTNNPITLHGIDQCCLEGIVILSIGSYNSVWPQKNWIR